MSKKPEEQKREEAIKLAREKYGYLNFVAHKESYAEVQEYADSYSGQEKAIANLFIMMTFNTSAYLRARRELKEEKEKK